MVVRFNWDDEEPWPVVTYLGRGVAAHWLAVSINLDAEDWIKEAKVSGLGVWMKKDGTPGKQRANIDYADLSALSSDDRDALIEVCADEISLAYIEGRKW